MVMEIDQEQKKAMENWKGKYLMTSWENYEDFLRKLGVNFFLRKLATMGTPIVEVTEEGGEWNIRRTTTVFFAKVKLRAVDFKFRIGEEFDEVTPDRRDVRSVVTAEGNRFIHESKAKKAGVTGHTVITEFNGDECVRYMTIHKMPEVQGVMKFRRVNDDNEIVIEEIEGDGEL